MARICSVWFTVLGALGLWFPYFSLYLKESAGLTGTEVGAVMALPPLAGIVMQPIWGFVADRTGARTRLLAVLVLGAALSSLLLQHARGFAAIATTTALYASFNVGVTPGLWSVSFALLKDEGARAVGYARASGTVGYGIMVASFPALLERLGPTSPTPFPGVERDLELIFPLAAVLLAVGSLLAWSLPRAGAVSARADRTDIRNLMHNGDYLRLLVVAFAVFLFNQGPMALFPILVRAHGGGVEAVSRMWIVMLVLEVPLIATFGTTERLLGVRRIIFVGLGAAALRWLVSGLVSSLAWITVVQALHGVTVWGFLLAAPAYVDRVVPANLRSSAQALLGVLGLGLGGTLSAIASGFVLDHYDAPTLATIAGALATGLLLILPWLLPRSNGSTADRFDTLHPDRS